MRKTIATIGIAVVASLGLATAATAQSDEEIAKQDRIDELERKVEVLTSELAKMREEQGVPEETELQSYSGLGPGLSRVFGTDRGLAMGGYAEGIFRGYVGPNADDTPNRADLLRLVLYAGYKFSDRLVFSSEIEFEHATTSDEVELLGNEPGEVSVELAQLDYLWRPEINARGGLLLMPMGFINEVHEPVFFNGVSRPVTETRIIPTTWRENGAGVYGTIAEQLTYRAYVVTGLDAQGLDSAALRGSRSLGSRARAEDAGGVLRLDWTPFDGGLFGGSVYYAGIDQSRDEFDDASLALWELHAQYRYRGLEMRALYAQAHIDGAGSITRTLQDEGELSFDEAVSNDWLGVYGEVGYDVMPWILPDRGFSLVPFFRTEWVNTQGDVPSGYEANDRLKTWVFVPGVNFKPHPNVVLKFDYRNFAPREGSQVDEVELGFGLVF